MRRLAARAAELVQLLHFADVRGEPRGVRLIAGELLADLVGLQCGQADALTALRIGVQDLSSSERNSSATAVQRMVASFS